MPIDTFFFPQCKKHVLQCIQLQGRYFFKLVKGKAEVDVGEDLAEVEWSAEVDSEFFFKENVDGVV